MKLARLILVTGKGGSGKSTAAAALALALAERGPATLVDLDQRMRAARALGISAEAAESNRPLETESVPLQSHGIENLEVTGLRPQAELEAFIERIVPIKAVARRMLASRTFGYVTAALPGLEAFLVLERMRLIAGRAALEDRRAVVDAPATGGAIELLSVAGGVRELAPIGTLNRIASGVENFIRDPNLFGVMLTVTPHELSLKEALEAARTLRERLGVAVIGAILNGVARPLFGAAEMAALEARDAGAAALARWRNGGGELAAAGVPVVTLPMLFEPAMGRREIAALGRYLAAGIRAGAGADTSAR